MLLVLGMILAVDLSYIWFYSAKEYSPISGLPSEFLKNQEWC